MSDLSKKIRVVCGHYIGDVVLVRDVAGKIAEKRAVRRVGAAGFLVKGLATCFYWADKGRTWDELPSTNREENA